MYNCSTIKSKWSIAKRKFQSVEHLHISLFFISFSFSYQFFPTDLIEMFKYIFCCNFQLWRLFFFFYFFLTLIDNSVSNPTKRDSEDFLSICPQSNSRAFASGRKCCNESESEKVSSWDNEFCPNNQFIDCPGLANWFNKKLLKN